MSEMNLRRRSLLKAGLVGVAAWPLMIKRAFACPPPMKCDELPPGVDDVEAAWQRAVAAKRPLLVLLIPEAPRERWERGELFGELLNHGTDDELAPLGLAEIVCAKLGAITTLVPAATKASATTMALVVETHVPASVAFVDGGGVPRYDERARRGFSPEEAAHEDEIGRKRIAFVAKALREALVTSSRPLPRDKVAAYASIVRATVVAVPPAGARWARGGGCGVQVEGEPPPSIRCGMGHTPKLSQRFLYFFTKEEAPY